MADNVISMEAYRYPWKEVFAVDGDGSTLQVYVNERTGEAEVVQMNNDGEVIRTQLSALDFFQMSEVTRKYRVISNKKGS